MTDIATAIHAFLVEETGMSEDEFNHETKLFSDGFIDSFTMTAVLAFLEDEAGVSIPQSDVTLENFDSIQNMQAYIARSAA